MNHGAAPALVVGSISLGLVVEIHVKLFINEIADATFVRPLDLNSIPQPTEESFSNYVAVMNPRVPGSSTGNFRDDELSSLNV